MTLIDLSRPNNGRSLRAARRVSAAFPTIKPLDEAAIVEAVRDRNRLVVVAENHSVIGGLGEAVASTLLRHRVQPASFPQAALPDAFPDAGALPTLHERYGIRREALGARIKIWLA